MNDPKEAIAYHYTNQSALLAILQAKNEHDVTRPTFRMTHCRFMNDESEYSLLVRMISETDALTTLYPKGAPHLRDALEGARQLLHQYVLSFAPSPEMLSQWRAYAPGISGVAIGVSRAALEKFEFKAVEYEDLDSSKLFLRLDAHLKAIDAELSSPDADENLCRAASRALNELLDSAIFTKSLTFGEEKELRAVRVALDPAGFFSGRYGVTPFVNLELECADIREIWLGPHSHGEVGELGLNYFKDTLSDGAYKHVRVLRFGAPLRP